jgi:hypothetical protein
MYLIYKRGMVDFVKRVILSEICTVLSMHATGHT